MDAAVVIGLAVLPVVVAFAMDQVRDKIGEGRLDRRLQLERARDVSLNAIRDTEGACRARVAWLQLRGTYPDQSWAYLQLLVSGHPEKDLRLLGAAYGEFIAGCDRMFKEPALAKAEPLFPASILRVAVDSLRNQRLLVEAKLPPVLTSDEVVQKVESEHAAFMAVQAESEVGAEAIQGGSQTAG